jgi:hypothetical protein
MNDLSHPVTQFNCTQPLRPHYVGQVDRDASTGLHRSGCDKNENTPDGLRYVTLANENGDNLGESKASPAAGNASGACICLEYIGDNGPCPVHGKRGAR